MSRRRRTSRPTGSSLLEKAIESLPPPMDDDWPLPLPVAHMSIARWFGTIVAGGRLVPRRCRVFKRDLLYLFYGGAFYRPKNFHTTQPLELPIAFVFEPSILNNVLRYYPFDTGAIASRKYPSANRILGPFKRNYAVKSDGTYKKAGLIVHHIFGDNMNYIKGHANVSCTTKPNPLPKLHEFLSADLTVEGLDHRQAAIECQFKEVVHLDRKLLWVGFPDSLMGEFGTLCDRMAGYVPEFKPYMSHRSFNPAEVAVQLERDAEQVIMRYASRPRSRP
jgi:hypothetical protein